MPSSLAPTPLCRAVDASRPALDLTATLPGEVGLWPKPVAQVLSGAAAAEARPEALGASAARAFIARQLGHDGARVDPEDVMLTASTTEAYAHLFKLLCDPGQAVAVVEPGYPLVPHIAALEGVRAVPYRLVERDPAGAAGWRLDLIDLARALGSGARAVVWVAPHNPTGHVGDLGEARALAALCRRHGAALVVDQVFRPFVAADWPALEAAWAEAGTTFFLGGLSKWAGLPHLKLGWLRRAGDAAHAREIMSRLAWIGDTFLSVNQPVQAALPALFAAGEVWRRRLTARLLRHRAWLRGALAGCPGARERSVDGWMSIVSAPLPPPLAEADEPDAAWAARLAELGVRVHPGFAFDLEAPPAEGPPTATWVTSLALPSRRLAAGWAPILAALGAPAAPEPALQDAEGGG